MKSLIAASLIVLSLTAHAQFRPQTPTEIRIQLYLDCTTAFGKNTIPEEKTVQGIIDYASLMDQNCVNWMALWHQPMLGTSINSWTKEEYDDFNGARFYIRNELVLLLKKALL